MTEAEQNRLIVENMALVGTVAAHYRGADIEYEDLLAVGRIGLVRAARNFDPTLGKFSAHAVARIETEISNAIRSGNYAKVGDAFAGLEDIKDWDHWGHSGNARAIYEIWPEDFDGSPETLAILFSDIKDKQAKFEAAFISLSPIERKLVQLVYLRDPPLNIADAARETRISYLRTWRVLRRSLEKMRKVIQRIESNRSISEGDANGPPLSPRPSRLSSRNAA